MIRRIKYIIEMIDKKLWKPKKEQTSFIKKNKGTKRSDIKRKNRDK